MRPFASWINNPLFIPAARIAGHYGLALVALLFPQLGENHLVVAALLALVFGPGAFILSFLLSAKLNRVIEPFVDMLTLLVVIGMLPEFWFYGLLIGVVIAQAPSMALSTNSYRLYGASSLLLVLGMTAIALFHGVESWLVPICILLAIFPSTLLYAISLNRKSNEIRERSAALTGLQLVAGGVGHDFNNILTSISGYAELAQTQSASAPGAQQALGKILESTDKASQLTRQLISLAGDKKPQFQTLDLGAEVRSVISMLEGGVRDDVRLKVSVPSSPVYLRGDGVQLSQVVLNLMVNALESIDGAGEVAVRVKYSDVSVILEIQDTGGGIGINDQAEIFEPFISSKSNGRGLGLAVVKNIVVQHSGSVEVDSQLGTGTTFTVTFPAVPAPVREEKSKAGNTILVADDEKQIRVILRHVLEAEGYEVLEAEDGLEFLQVFAEQGADICAVILDIKMPGKTGWQCLEEVRETSRAMPVLLISGYDPDGPRLGQPDNALRFLAKPFRIAEIKDAVGDLLLIQSKAESA